MQERNGHLVVMVGAGPAALYATAKLTETGHTVMILNRDIKPGGLAEYGIYPSKHQMKEGLRKHFRRILADPRVVYFGNVQVGAAAAVSLSDLKDLKPSAIVGFDDLRAESIDPIADRRVVPGVGGADHQ